MISRPLARDGSKCPQYRVPSLSRATLSPTRREKGEAGFSIEQMKRPQGTTALIEAGSSVHTQLSIEPQSGCLLKALALERSLPLSPSCECLVSPETE